MINDYIKDMVRKKSGVKSDQILIKSILNELNKVVIGHPEIVKTSVMALITKGNLLIDGIPGSAKTLLANSLVKTIGLNSVRIQGRPYLNDKDFFGEKVKGKFFRGPLFHKIIIIDQINRIEPENQSMLFEAMEERQVTLGARTYKLYDDFFVIGTMTSLDEGIFPLTGNLLDRFMFSVNIGYPNMEEEHMILHNNEEWEPKKITPKAVILYKQLTDIRNNVKKVYMNTEVHKYILRIVNATRNPKKYNIPNQECLLLGCSSRGAIALMIAAKADAFIEGSHFVTPQNVKNVAHDVLRHRIIMSDDSIEKEITPDLIINDILKRIPVP